MKTIKSKKSYIDFEDLFDDEELNYKKCKKKEKKKKHKSSKKSSNKKITKKMIKQNIEITNDFFGLNNKQAKQAKQNYEKTTYHYSKSLLGRIADSVNVDAKFNIDISDDFVNNVFLIVSGVISKLLLKGK